MTLASTKRIGALALAATVFVAACGGSAATSTLPPLGAAGQVAAVVRRDLRVRLVHRRAHLDRRRRGLRRGEPGLQVHRRGPGHRRRLQEVLRRRDRHLRRLAHDQGRRGRRLRRQRRRVRRAQGRDRRHVGPDVREQHGCRLPQPRGSVRADRARVHRLRQVERRRGNRQGARVPAPSSPTRTSRSPDPARSLAPSTASSSSRSPRSPRSATRSPTPAPTTPPRPTTTRSSTGSRAATPRSAGSASPSPRRTRTRSARSQVSKDVNGTCVAPHARDHRRRVLPAVPPPLHLRQQGQGRREPRRRRLRRLLPGRGHDRPRSSRPSPTSISRPRRSPRRGPPGTRRSSPALSPPPRTGRHLWGVRPVRSRILGYRHVRPHQER